VAFLPPHCSAALPAQGTLFVFAQVLETVVTFVMVSPQEQLVPGERMVVSSCVLRVWWMGGEGETYHY